LSIEERLARLEARIEDLTNHISMLEQHVMGLARSQQKTIRWVIIMLIVILGALAGVKIIP